MFSGQWVIMSVRSGVDYLEFTQSGYQTWEKALYQLLFCIQPVTGSITPSVMAIRVYVLNTKLVTHLQCQITSIMGHFFSVPNWILFPKPQPSYNAEQINRNNNVMFSINTQRYGHTCTYFRPCLSHDGLSLSDRAIIYFHGNGQDIGSSQTMIQEMGQILMANVFVNQYPGYGIYTTKTPSPQRISLEGQILYDFVKNELCFKNEDIIVVGRSIGTGPACHVASKYKCHSLILVSPFQSLIDMIDQRVYILSCFFQEGFPNSTHIRDLKAEKLLVIHGQKDEVISVDNSRALQEVFRATQVGKRGLFLYPKYMTHNQFNFKRDILEPMRNELPSSPTFHKEYHKVLKQINKLKIQQNV